MRKLMVLLLMLSLLAAGCTEEGKTVTQAVINGLDLQSYQGRGVLRVELSPGAEEEIPPEVLEVLQQGITVEYAQQGAEQLMMEIKLPMPVELPVPETSLSTISLYISGQTAYIRIFPDDPYIKIDSEELLASSGMTPELGISGLAGFSSAKMERDKKFFKSYIETFGFKLPKITNHGSVNLSLPDGNVDTTYYQITLNEVDLKNMILYILKDLQSNKIIEDYLRETITEMAAIMGEEASQKELDEDFFAEMRDGLEMAIMVLETFDMNDLGVKVTYDSHNWIDEQGYARKNVSEILVSGGPLPDDYLKLVSETEMWNINKPVNISFPENYISLAEIMADETVIMNTKLFQVIDFFAAPSTYSEMIISELQIGNPQYTVNWETAMMETAPYLLQKKVFVPASVLADILGAQLIWNDEAQEGYFFDGINEILVAIDKGEAVVNGEVVVIGAPVHIKNGSIMVPLRAISEAVGAEVIWRENTKEITVIKY